MSAGRLFAIIGEDLERMEIMAAGKYMLKVFGCQMSFRDGESLAGQLQQVGYLPTDDESKADIIVFQTCCVRESAERKIYGRINQLKGLKNNKPALIIGVSGCLAQKDRELVFKRCPHVDFVLGTHQLGKLPQVLTDLSTFRHLILVDEAGQDFESMPAVRTQGVRAYVNITYGCSNFCSYCIVPYVRGVERSRELQDIVLETKAAIEEGYPEIMLLGQNVNTYGLDLNRKGTNFVSLLKTLDSMPNLKRIRYMTSHPRDFTKEMVETVKNARSICEHFHLPIQSGSNRILSSMNRGYTRDHYLQLIDGIRVLIPGASITTDLIVGFPGETEADFADTLDLVERVQFDAAYTFMFSPRRGTKAATFNDQIPSKVKKERLKYLNTIQGRNSRMRNQLLIGQDVEVLVEGVSKNNAEMLAGRTRTNKLVHFKGSKQLSGELVTVSIKGAYTWTLHGRLVS